MTKRKNMEVNMASLSPLIEEVIGNGTAAELTVAGNSMHPFLRHNVSRVRISRADVLRNGDVVLYRRDNGAYVLHRIVKIKNGSYIMCGDNQYVLECGIRRDQILAVMTSFSRDGVRWKDALSFGHKMYSALWSRSRLVRRTFRGAKRRLARLLQNF